MDGGPLRGLCTEVKELPAAREDGGGGGVLAGGAGKLGQGEVGLLYKEGGFQLRISIEGLGSS